MATIPVPITWVAGTVVTAGQMNSNIRDATNFLLATPFCSVFRNGALSLLANTLTLVSWDAENEDNDNMHSTVTNPSRITFQTTGLYLFTVGSSYGPTAADQGRRIMVRLNSGGSSGGGSQVAIVDAATNATPAAIGSDMQPQIAFYYRALNVGDYLETFFESTVAQGITAGNLNYFQINWTGQ